LEEGLKFCRKFVQRLLEFARMNPVDKRNHDVTHTIESVTGFFLPVVQSKRAKLVTDTAQARGLQVCTDRNLFEAVLLILLSNALDATPAGGEIQVSCYPLPEGSVEIAVRDTGSGIAPANLARVFEPFFTTKEPGMGTGLGLAIAKNFVSEHGGSIRIESEPAQGATAYIDLPLAAGIVESPVR
jgi:signal transduction histidine kinase